MFVWVKLFLLFLFLLLNSLLGNCICLAGCDHYSLFFFFEFFFFSFLFFPMIWNLGSLVIYRLLSFFLISLSISLRFLIFSHFILSFKAIFLPYIALVGVCLFGLLSFFSLSLIEKERTLGCFFTDFFDFLFWVLWDPSASFTSVR